MLQLPFMNVWRKNGIVEWFDTKKGYGFINSTDGEKYFVHHSKINAPNDCKFKYLKKGEHVDFDIKGCYKQGDNAKYIAINITGHQDYILDCISSQTKKDYTANKEEWILLDE